jgi:hypothetical protein
MAGIGQQQNNTMAEGVRKMLQTITDMKLMPDADLPTLIDWETNFIDYLRPPTPESQSPVAAMPGGMEQMAPAMAQTMQAPMPNMDEMRRMTSG